mmetsp:Transcript_7235/g.14952  ORF Transcript_7235/g.14952 Transcript_7235/m.14952 type:complete len:387 (+) Transcript_7235:113-1273(+)
MEPQHGLPEGSAPLVLLPSPQFRSTYSIGRTEVTTNSGTRTTASMMMDPRRMGGVTTSTSAVRTSNSFSIIGSHGNVASSAGPTTRSRLRSHNTVRSLTSSSVRSTTSTAVPPPVANPSRKRKAPTSSSSERSKAPRIRGHRKKPPPGTDLRKAPPQVKSEKDDDKKPAAVVNCCICMSDVEPNDVAKIDGCDHRFCFCCIEKWSERENKCPLCKIRFHKIERIHRKYTKGSKNTKKVKQKDQRSDLSSGAALEGLIANLQRNSGGTSLARIIFGNIEFGGTAPAAAISTSTSRSASGVHAEFADSSDDSDDESPMAAFMRALHGSSVANGMSMTTTVVRPMTVTATAHFSTRSFARNVHDSTAGRGADNPLEIDDDSVEEVIEID